MIVLSEASPRDVRINSGRLEPRWILLAAEAMRRRSRPQVRPRVHGFALGPPRRKWVKNGESLLDELARSRPAERRGGAAMINLAGSKVMREPCNSRRSIQTRRLYSASRGGNGPRAASVYPHFKLVRSRYFQPAPSPRPNAARALRLYFSLYTPAIQTLESKQESSGFSLCGLLLSSFSEPPRIYIRHSRRARERARRAVSVQTASEQRRPSCTSSARGNVRTEHIRPTVQKKNRKNDEKKRGAPSVIHKRVELGLCPAC